MIQYITSRQNAKIKQLLTLRTTKGRQEEGAFLIEGYHMLEMAITAGIVLEIYTLKEIEDPHLTIPQYIISEDILGKIAVSKTAQGVVAKCKLLSSHPVEKARILYLDGVSDPGNVGTILRTALAFDYKDVILGEKCASLYNEKVITATQGALFKLNIVPGNLEMLKELHKKYKIIATSLKSQDEVKDLPQLSNHIVVVGNEGNGVSDSILAISDYNVIIKMSEMESLNVAVATGIMLYELSKGGK